MKGNIKKDKKANHENVYEDNVKCPLLYALDIIGQKWKLPIIWSLSECDTMRYNELKRKVVGITDTMLIKSLKELEDSKIIIRTQYNTIPPKVEYSLTEGGARLLPTLNELSAWGEEQMKVDFESAEKKIK